MYEPFFLIPEKSHWKVGDSFQVNPHGTCGKDGGSREQVKNRGRRKTKENVFIFWGEPAVGWAVEKRAEQAFRG